MFRCDVVSLTLVRTQGKTGFKAVCKSSKPTRDPYQVGIKRNGRHQSLGTYSSAAEAALAYARFLGPEKSAAEALNCTVGLHV